MSRLSMRAAGARLFAREVGRLLRLALPLILGQLFGIGTDFVLTVLGGHMGPRVMAAVSLGASLWIVAFMTVLGVMMSVQPAIAALHGAREEDGAGHVYAQALLLGLAWGSLIGAILGLVAPLFAGALGLPPAVVPGVRAFLHGAAFSIPALGLFAACRGLSEGLSMTRPTMLVGGFGLLCLIPVAFILMRGLGGIGGYGPLGGGLAISFVLCTEALCYILWISLSGRYPMVRWSRAAFRLDPRVLGRLFRVGAPIAGALIMEVCMFSVATLMVGRFGPVAVAGHQVALMTSAIFFMVPLGLSLAVTVRVGRARGARDVPGLRRASFAGLAVMLCTQLVSGGCMLGFAEPIARIFTHDPAVVQLGASLLGLAGLFQFADGTQVVAMAALRGLEDTKTPMLLAMLAYWCLGIPLGGLLAFAGHLGVRGVWFGLMGGLILAALLLVSRLMLCLWRAGRGGLASLAPAGPAAARPQ